MIRIRPTSQNRTLQLSTVVSFSIVAFYILVYLVHLSLRHWSDSEIWGVRQAAACMADWGHYGCNLKPMFNFLFGNFHSLVTPKSLASEMTWMRYLGLIPTFVMAVLLWVRAEKSPLILICFVASSLFLLDLSFIRSDVSTLGWLLLHAALLTDLRSKVKNRLRLPLLVASLLMAVSLTPKMGLVFFCFLPLYIREIGWRRSAYVGSGSIAFALLSFTLTSIFDIPAAATFFTASFDGRNLGVSYLSYTSFQFVIRAIKENPALVVAMLILIGTSLNDLIRRRSPVALSALLILPLIFFYPDKLPFFIGCLVLVFLYLATESLKSIEDSRHLVRTSLALAAGVATVLGVHWTTVLRATSNNSQRALAESLATILEPYPAARVVDSLGILVERPLVSIFLGPDTELARKEVIANIKSRDYEIIVETMKVLLVEPVLADTLSQYYIEASNGVFVRSVELTIKNPKMAAEEILEALQSNFSKHLTPDSKIAIFNLNEEANRWEFTGLNVIPYSDLIKRPKICETCKVIRVTPFGTLFGPILPAEFRQEFTFESRTPRPLPFMTNTAPEAM